jgi:hypothetical protein
LPTCPAARRPAITTKKTKKMRFTRWTGNVDLDEIAALKMSSTVAEGLSR